MAVPKFDEMFSPLLKALHELGGSGTNNEIEEKTAVVLGLSDEDLNEMHRGSRTKFSYRLAWSRNYLKRYGLLENSDRGIWALTPKGQDTLIVNPLVLKKSVKYKPSGAESDLGNEEVSLVDATSPEWEAELLDRIMEISPKSFEHLVQRILRESGFDEVVITGQANDRGIDGYGTFRMGGLISFKVMFQCKRYSKSVPSHDMREFKGTMYGRSEKGLFVTTGTFTREAKREAQREGTAPIDLIDGEQLVQIMKNLRLGVKVTTKEMIQVEAEWFERFV